MAWSSQSVPGIFPVGTRKMRQWEGRDSSFRYTARQDEHTLEQSSNIGLK